MNWTGGRLQRHSKNGRGGIVSKQKQYFAKARAGFLNSDTAEHEFVPSFIDDTETNRRGRLIRSKRQVLLDEYDYIAPLVDRLGSIGNRGRRTSARVPSSPGVEARAGASQATGVTTRQLQDHDRHQSSSYVGRRPRIHQEHSSIHEMDKIRDVDGKRKKLLGQNDWAGLRLHESSNLRRPRQATVQRSPVPGEVTIPESPRYHVPSINSGIWDRGGLTGGAHACNSVVYVDTGIAALRHPNPFLVQSPGIALRGDRRVDASMLANMSALGELTKPERVGVFDIPGAHETPIMNGSNAETGRQEAKTHYTPPLEVRPNDEDERNNEEINDKLPPSPQTTAASAPPSSTRAGDLISHVADHGSIWYQPSRSVSPLNQADETLELEWRTLVGLLQHNSASCPISLVQDSNSVSHSSPDGRPQRSSILTNPPTRCIGASQAASPLEDDNIRQSRSVVSGSHSKHSPDCPASVEANRDGYGQTEQASTSVVCSERVRHPEARAQTREDLWKAFVFDGSEGDSDTDACSMLVQQPRGDDDDRSPRACSVFVHAYSGS